MSPDSAPAVRALVEAWLSHHAHVGAYLAPPAEITLRRVEVLRPGRPGLLDVVAEVDGRVAHLVAGLLEVGDEPHFLRAGEDAVLGLLEDEHGLAVCVDALRDARLAPLLLATIREVDTRPGPVATVRDDDEATVLDCGDRGDLMVFPWLRQGPHPGVDLLVALDAAGFNHVAAPLVRWTWDERDLGVVQEPLADRSGGLALAITSLRDFYATGGRPEAAGGDFGPEAHALGTMAARMHLALDRAFGRQPEPLADWIDAAEAEIAAADRTRLDAPGVADLTQSLREVDVRLAVIRTHGDFHLGRTSRTDQGWVVSDCTPGSIPPGAEEPAMRSPLADVADLLWSLHQASLEAAVERDPAGRLGLAAFGQAWETRNRRAVLSGYLGTPGIAGLTGANRDVVRNLVALFELVRSVRESSN
jgi:predicted trehalose synthase